MDAAVCCEDVMEGSRYSADSHGISAMITNTLCHLNYCSKKKKNMLAEIAVMHVVIWGERGGGGGGGSSYEFY